MYNPRDEEDQAESDYMVVRLLIDKNRQGRSKIKIDTAFVGANMRFCSLVRNEGTMMRYLGIQR